MIINKKKSKMILIDFKILMTNSETLKGMKMLIFNIHKSSKILIIKILEINGRGKKSLVDFKKSVGPFIWNI